MGIFVEREDKPKYLLVGKMDGINGMTPYVNYDHLRELLKSHLDKPFFDDINGIIMQEVMDAVYGKNVFDLKNNLMG